MSTLAQQYEMQATIARRPFLPAISWGAIVAGIAVGLSIQLLLTLLGVATGLSAIDVREQGAGVGSALTSAGIWQGVSLLVSVLAAGYIAGRMSGLHRKGDGLLHGLVAWAVILLLIAWLTTSAIGSLFGGIFSGVTTAAQTAVAGDVQINTPALASRIQALISGNGKQAAQKVSAQDLQAVQQSIQAGDRDAAISHLVDKMGFERQRAATLVDQALVVSGEPGSASPQAVSKAQGAVDSARTASWWTFAAVALSLIIGAFGGTLGTSARRANRTATRADVGGGRAMDGMGSRGAAVER
jgi:hypothetical protein